jgi:hypothetical protein
METEMEASKNRLFNALVNAGASLQQKQEHEEKVFVDLKDCVQSTLSSLNDMLLAAKCDLRVRFSSHSLYASSPLTVVFSSQREDQGYKLELDNTSHVNFSNEERGVAYFGKRGFSLSIRNPEIFEKVENALGERFQEFVDEGVGDEDKIKAATYYKKINAPSVEM